MRRFLAICLLLAVGFVCVAADEPTIARRALGDELWEVALRHAGWAETNAPTAVAVREARRIQLESLARAGDAQGILAAVTSWREEGGELARYLEAWALCRLERSEEARALLLEPFADDALRMLSLRLLARVSVALGKQDEITRAFQAVSRAFVSNDVVRAENALEWAQAVAARGDLVEARRILVDEGTLTGSHAVNDAARLLAADLALKLGEGERAKELFRQVVAKGSEVEEDIFVQASCAWAEILRKTNLLTAAIEVTSNAVVRAKRLDLVRRAGYALGFLQLERDELRAEGIARIRALVQRFPGASESREAQLRLADELLLRDDAAGAIREYDLYMRTFSDLDARPVERRAWAYLKLGRRAEAVGAFARASMLSSDEETRARCLLKQGDALLLDDRFDEAAEIYAKVSPKTSFGARAAFQHADALERGGRVAEASEAFEKLFLRGGELAVKAGLRAAAAKASSALGQGEQSIALYNRLLGVATSPVVDRTTAAALEGDEDLAQTEKPASGGAEKPIVQLTKEERVAALYGRGRASCIGYRWEEAEADFVEVARLEPQRAGRMKYLVALCQYGAGKDEEALAAMRALRRETAPSALLAEIDFWLAKYAVAHGAAAEAIVGFEACATNSFLAPVVQVEAQMRAARCAASSLDYLKVVEIATKAVMRPRAREAEAKLLPETPFLGELRLLQGEALTELARFDEAVLVLDLVTRMPVSDYLRRRAQIQKGDSLLAMGADDDGRYRQALETYRAVVQDDQLPPSTRLSVSFRIGRALEKLRREEEAIDQYYVNVVLACSDAVKEGAWFDAEARTAFARAVFILADYYESQGQDKQAFNMLGYLEKSDSPSASEARRRRLRLKEKGGF